MATICLNIKIKLYNHIAVGDSVKIKKGATKWLIKHNYFPDNGFCIDDNSGQITKTTTGLNRVCQVKIVMLGEYFNVHIPQNWLINN
jgi:hypothetical protein